MQVEGAVVVHLHVGAAHVDLGDGRALHGRNHAHAAHPMGGRPVPFSPLFIPADGLGPAVNALVQSARMDHLFHALAALAQGLEDLGGFALPDVPAFIELQHIHAEFAGDDVHLLAQGEVALGGAVAPVSAAHRQVGVHRAAVEPEMGDFVQKGQGFGPRVGQNRERVGPVGPGVHQSVHLQGHNGPVLPPDPGFQADLHLVAGAGGEEHLFPAEHQPAGAPGAPGGQAHQRLQQHLLFAAEASADAGLDHPDLPQRNAEHHGGDPAGVEGHLGAGDDHEPALFVQVRQGGVGFQGAVAHVGGTVFVLNHEIGLGEAPGRIAVGELHLGGQVAGGVVGHGDLGELVVGVEFGGVGLQGLLHVKHGGQHPVGHPDALEGFLGDVRGFGGHHGHPVAHEAHLSVEEHRVVGGGLGIPLAGGGVQHPGHIAVMEHGHHAVQGLGLRGVQVHDLGVGVGRVQDLEVQGIAEFKVVGEPGRARGQGHGVNLLYGVPNTLELGHLALFHRWAARRTPSRILT